jgi:mRNA interferase MazF
MAKIISPVRGEVYLINFDPTTGSEIKKTRPALILQNDVANEHSPITIVAAIASKFDDNLYPTEVEISAGEGGLRQDSVILLNQIRSIDRLRLVKRLGKIEDSTLKRINLSIKISLGLIEI